MQLAVLDRLDQQLRARLDQVELDFAEGRIFAPIGGIVSTKLAHVGQSLVAGNAIAEILDPSDVFVDWYIPNERLIDPEVGNGVFVVVRQSPLSWKDRRNPAGLRRLCRRQRPGPRASGHTDRAHPLRSDGVPPALNSTVYVNMYYTEAAARVAAALAFCSG